jgi:rod shape determining protein RodA
VERPWYTRFNWPLAIAPVLVTLLGIVFIRSATLHNHYAADEWRKQLIYGAVGIAMMVGAAFLDYRVWRRWALPLYLATLALLLFIGFKGHSALGAARWIQIGPFQFQPSEPAKVVLAIAIAALLCRGTYRKIQELWGTARSSPPSCTSACRTCSTSACTPAASRPRRRTCSPATTCSSRSSARA